MDSERFKAFWIRSGLKLPVWPSASWVRWACAVAVAVTLAVAGIPKLLHPGEFMRDIENFRMVIRKGAWLAAFFIPALELVTAVLLLRKRWQCAGGILALLLMAVFSFALFSAWIRGLEIDCGCFGRQGRASATDYPLSLLRNLALGGASFVVAVLACREEQTRARLT